MSIATQLHLQLPAPQPGAEGGDSLPDRLCALLARRGRPLEVGHVAAQLLRLRGCPERLQRRLVAEIVEGDARLAWLGRDLVGLAPPDWSSTELTQAVFCVVDLETTGGAPGHSKVTEIGAVRIRALEVEERFATLVNPGRPIPPVVTDLTGIDDAMVADEPRDRGGAGGVRDLRRPGRARGPQRPVRPALPQLRAPPPVGALLHPALARHPGARAASPQRPRPPPRPRHPGGVGGDARSGRRTGRSRTPRPPPRCSSGSSGCWPSAASTPWSGPWPSAAWAAPATRTSWPSPRTCRPGRACT